MATFDTDKGPDDIDKPELLEDDWYLCRIVREPKKEPNSKKKANLPEEQGAGLNLNLFLRVQHENPKMHGRPFFVSLPWPTEYDKTQYDQSGMTIADQKWERLFNWSHAFQGKTSKAKRVIFNAGDEALVYIEQTYDFREGREEDLINSINMFQTIPRKAP